MDAPAGSTFERFIVRCVHEGCSYNASALGERRAIGCLVEHLRSTHGLQLMGPPHLDPSAHSGQRAEMH